MAVVQAEAHLRMDVVERSCRLVDVDKADFDSEEAAGRVVVVVAAEEGGWLLDDTLSPRAFLWPVQHRHAAREEKPVWRLQQRLKSDELLNT